MLNTSELIPERNPFNAIIRGVNIQPSQGVIFSDTTVVNMLVLSSILKENAINTFLVLFSVLLFISCDSYSESPEFFSWSTSDFSNNWEWPYPIGHNLDAPCFMCPCCTSEHCVQIPFVDNNSYDEQQRHQAGPAHLGECINNRVSTELPPDTLQFLNWENYDTSDPTTNLQSKNQPSFRKDSVNARTDNLASTLRKTLGTDTSPKGQSSTANTSITRQTQYDNPNCKYPAAEKNHLKKQKQSHTGEKPFACDYPGCMHSTTTKNCLIRHKRTHSGEHPFACNHPGCTYSSATQYCLKRHKLIHTDTKPFKCNHPGCSYSATANSYLVVHSRIHTGEKPFKCNYPECAYSATNSGSLVRHKRVHTGEKPFQCDHPGCIYSTTTGNNLKVHKYTHGGTKPYPCNHSGCNFSTVRRNLLIKHQRTHNRSRPVRKLASSQNGTSRNH